MDSDQTEPKLPAGTTSPTPPTEAPKTPVDGAAQEEAAKVREESGGYD